jgi:iron complex transport system substrate-binding protein
VSLWQKETITQTMKSKSILILAIVCVSVLLSQCGQPKQETASPGKGLKYAKGFTVKDFGSYKEVEVTHPYKGARTGYRYLLVQEGNPVPDHASDVQVISIPLKNIVCTSTTHIPLLDYLGETDKLIGFPTTDYINSIPMRKRIDEGSVVDLGIDKGMNVEKLITLQPSMVMGYAMTADLGQLKKIHELGVPVVINSEYLEEHPLGRAEWIKFMALFFNQEEKADSVFGYIEAQYVSAAKATATIAEDAKPTVMSGVVYGDTWFLPGGKNYAAKLLNDAGANYLWKADTTSGYLELSLESVYAKAHDADFWIGIGLFNTLDELKASEERYASFKAFKQGNIYSYNGRKGAKGWSEFLELGYLRPDLILNDLVKILHPDLLPGYQLYFHKKLK